MSQTSTHKDFEGVWTAIATPFLSNMDIDWESYEKLVDFQKQNSIKGIVVCGTTGEAPSLTLNEKLSLIKKTRELVGSSYPVMAGVGSSNTHDTIDLAEKALANGADSLLVVTPPYNKPSPAGLVAHFTAIAEATDAPICLYHVPGRTAQLLSPEVISRITEVPNVVAVKEASGDIGLFSRARLQSKAAFLSGDDPTYLASLAVGGIGAISVASNVFPQEMVAMTQAYTQGDIAKATRYNDILLPAIDILFCETNPTPLKAALSSLGFGDNRVRLPLATVLDSNDQMIRKVISETKQKLLELN